MRPLFLILYFAFAIPSYTQVQKYTPKVMLAMETYAFLKGQSAALTKVAHQFPTLRDDVKAVQNNSKVIFGRAERNIEHFLKEEMDHAQFNLLQQGIDNMLNENLKQPIEKEEYARDFLEKVRLEILLSKESGIQKSIISFAYHDAPHQEVIDGHTVQFTTKTPRTAANNAITLSIPKSWSAEDPQITQTVQQFTSHDGKGNAKILVLVHELTPEFKDIVLNQKSITNMIPPQTSLLRTEAVTIDGLPGIMIEVEEILSLSHSKQKIRMLQFMFAHNQKLYCLQGSIGPADIIDNLAPDIKKYEPLFRLVATGAQIVD